MSWEVILKRYDPTDDLVDEPLTEHITWKGKDYFIYDTENNSGVPNGIIYVYKTYHKPTGTLSYPTIKLYLYEGEIREWTDDDQKEFDMEVDSNMFDVWADAKSKEKFVRDNK
jgi:hypothetical protein|tara:strand:+ start:2785 stop:3123 length:339 start_codon:yes stop_codon:yes gene_type:complete